MDGGWLKDGWRMDGGWLEGGWRMDDGWRMDGWGKARGWLGVSGGLDGGLRSLGIGRVGIGV